MATIISVLQWIALTIQFACCLGLATYAMAAAVERLCERWSSRARVEILRSHREQSGSWRKGPNVKDMQSR